MIDIFLVIALILMIVGIIGSLYPVIPGPLVSIAGALIYWWSTGYNTPGNIILGLIIFTGIFAIILDTLASYIGAKRSDTSRKTALMAAAASIILIFFTGPLGIFIGTGLVVTIKELLDGEDLEKAVKSGLYTTLAMVGSAVAKVGFTFLMLIFFIISLII
jgi:uncharacterized protein YqgC (DUF456 family)